MRRTKCCNIVVVGSGKGRNVAFVVEYIYTDLSWATSMLISVISNVLLKAGLFLIIPFGSMYVGTESCGEYKLTAAYLGRYIIMGALSETGKSRLTINKQCSRR
ncbi:hypothetical protein F5Y13DRAFT_153352 [Hypoxylon sp. FL1857]|nr:hypothetical protein F5Y13DRAFT_153352 [Hypoxylon sp. FL1857]